MNSTEQECASATSDFNKGPLVSVVLFATWRACGAAAAGELVGRVVANTDGDTLTILDKNPG